MYRYVKASAMRRSDLGAWIEERTFPVMCALAQLYVFPDNVNKNHWRREVWANFNRMQVVKRRNKLPSAQFIFDNSWEVNKLWCKRAIQYVCDKEIEYVPDFDRKQNVSMFENLAEDYFRWLAIELSQTNTLQAQDVYNKLADLGL